MMAITGIRNTQTSHHWQSISLQWPRDIERWDLSYPETQFLESRLFPDLRNLASQATKSATGALCLPLTYTRGSGVCERDFIINANGDVWVSGRRLTTGANPCADFYNLRSGRVAIGKCFNYHRRDSCSRRPGLVQYWARDQMPNEWRQLCAAKACDWVVDPVACGVAADEAGVAFGWTLIDKMDGNLEDLMDRAAMGVDEVLDVCEKICKLVSDAWESGFHHSDIQAKNIGANLGFLGAMWGLRFINLKNSHNAMEGCSSPEECRRRVFSGLSWTIGDLLQKKSPLALSTELVSEMKGRMRMEGEGCLFSDAMVQKIYGTKSIPEGMRLPQFPLASRWAADPDAYFADVVLEVPRKAEVESIADLWFKVLIPVMMIYHLPEAGNVAEELGTAIRKVHRVFERERCKQHGW